MGKILSLCTTFIIFFLLVKIGYSTPFNATIYPETLIEGVKNQQINFTITNLQEKAIVRVDIILPEGIIFTGYSDANTTNPFYASTSEPSWWAASDIGLIITNETVNFTIWVDISHISGEQSFTVKVTDKDDVISSKTLTANVLDLVAPIYSNISVSPSSDSEYVINREYEFSLVWSDNVAVSVVQIEHNFTGSFKNETMEKINSIWKTKFVDLSAGIYTWRAHANDTSSNLNSTSWFTYSIKKASSWLNVYLNDFLNKDIVSILNQPLNIVAETNCKQPDCSITIRKNGVLIGTLAHKVAGTVSTTDTLTSVGLYRYEVSMSGNQNYTSATKNCYVCAIPGYSISKQIPSIYSKVPTSINISFDQDPKLIGVTINGNWEETPKNYTMSRISNLYYYLNVLPAGTFSWGIHAKCIDRLFEIVPSSSFKIEKVTPTLRLTATPSWILDEPDQTNVTCVSEIAGLEVRLYRDGVPVSNPDIQNFSYDTKHLYVCNTTGNQNYTSNGVAHMLVIKPLPSASLVLEEVPNLIEVEENSTKVVVVKVKNTGNVDQTVTLNVEGINEGWYFIAPSSQTTAPNTTIEFRVRFGTLIGVGEYTGIFNASSTNASDSENFILKVLPSKQREFEINYTFQLLKLAYLRLSDEFKEMKDKILDVSRIEKVFTDLELLLNQTDAYIKSADYFQSHQALAYLQNLLKEAENLLKTAPIKEGRKKGEVEIDWRIVVIASLIAFAGVFIKFIYPKLRKRVVRGEVIRYIKLLEGKKKETETS
ncbi:MAG: hypothetical protein QMD14_01200 [Candidatus Aenigmarchaeota archaeon]|nr:hypothetical protein [Candidatus Aenigmarchaeota archaeon]